ncbi:GNAT family N-acetyltransferase [Streptomyces sp. NPDC048629]|uniref:GNAT family N-acetyltransferase n=1 Tax=Streptomyces sp. NPDC048629 TaxID=3154824 RepID=UPI00342423E5
MVGIREMTESDADAVAGVRVDGWRSAYAGIVPRTWLDRMTVAEDALRQRTRLAEPGRAATDLVATDPDGAVVGWTCFGPVGAAGAPGPDWAELYTLYVRPDLIGHGVGRALLDEVHTRAGAAGFAGMLLWVLADNHRARRFYDRAGYAPDGAVQNDTYDDVVLDELRYRRTLAR